MERYKNKICLITASSTGIGFAIALKMASEGGTIIISSRNKENVEKSVEKIRQAGFNAIGFTFHVGNKIQRANLMKFIQEKFGKLDVLVLNAAVNPHVGDQFEITESKMDKIYEINIKSTFFLIQESLFLMKKGEDPNILMITTFGVYNINTNIAFYTVSKLAINAMMKTLARQLNKEGIRVNTLAPGFTRTKFSEIMHKYDEKSLDFRRLGEVEDVANAAAFLCSKEADYIVGEIFTLAGFVNSRL